MKLPTIQSLSCAEADNAVLILKPERATAIPGGQIQFAAFLRTKTGETALSNASFLSLTPSVLTIDPSTGIATMVAAGSSIVSAAYQDMMTFARVAVVAACSGVRVGFQVVIDNSLSMGDPFNSIYTKLGAAKTIARGLTDAIQSKDLVGLASFNTYFRDAFDISAVLPGDADYAKIEPTHAATIISQGLIPAFKNLFASTATQKVVVLLSDGDSRPRICQEDEEHLIGAARRFKDAGGIIIVVGICAAGHGFNLLQQIASNGFFINTYGDGVTDGAITYLTSLANYFCSSAGSVNLIPMGSMYGQSAEILFGFLVVGGGYVVVFGDNEDSAILNPHGVGGDPIAVQSGVPFIATSAQIQLGGLEPHTAVTATIAVTLPIGLPIGPQVPDPTAIENTVEPFSY